MKIMNVIYNIKCICYLFVFIMCNPVLGQESDSTNNHGNIFPDSSNINDHSRVLYSLSPSLKFNQLQLSLSKAKYLDDFVYLDLLERNPNLQPENSMLSLKLLGQKKLQNDLRYTFDWIQKDQQKHSLGWIGQALGYINTAAALGLAAYHVYKYEIKKKKKE